MNRDNENLHSLGHEVAIPADYELAHLPHTVVTPHVAFATAQAFEKRADIIAENLKSWL